MLIQNWSTWGNSMERWLIALALALGMLIVLRVMERYGAPLLQIGSSKCERDLWSDRFAGQTHFNTGHCDHGVFAGSRVLALPAPVEKWLSAVVVITVIIQTAMWGNELLVFGLRPSTT